MFEEKCFTQQPIITDNIFFKSFLPTFNLQTTFLEKRFSQHSIYIQRFWEENISSNNQFTVSVWIKTFYPAKQNYIQHFWEENVSSSNQFTIRVWRKEFYLATNLWEENVLLIGVVPPIGDAPLSLVSFKVGLHTCFESGKTQSCSLVLFFNALNV